MNQIIENLNKIRQEREEVERKYSEALDLVHQQYKGRIESLNKRYDAYQIVINEIGLNALDAVAPSNNETKQDAENEQSLQITKEPRHPAQKYDMPIGDAVQLVFEDANKPLTIEEVKSALADLRIEPSPASVRSVLAKDKRFFKISRGFYRLRLPNDIEEVVDEDEDENEVQAVNGTMRKPLTELIKELAQLKDGEQFTDEWIFTELQNMYPDEITEERRRSIQATLGNLVRNGDLDKLKRGDYGNPAIYRVKVSDGEEKVYGGLFNN